MHGLAQTTENLYRFLGSMSFRVAFFPDRSQLAENPYWALLSAGLEQIGVDIVDFGPSGPAAFGRRWLWRNRGRIQAIHFHFVQPFYAFESTQARLRWVIRFATNLLLARALGYCTVFTVHDLEPTYPLTPKWVDFLGYWATVNLVHQVVVHCHTARALVTQKYGRARNIAVVPHGSFVGVYPNELDSIEARHRLGLEHDLRVFVFVGGLRPNKGLDELIRVFSSLPGENLRLIIAGKPWPPPQYQQLLHVLAEQDPRVRLVPGFIPEDQLQLYLKAADIVVLPFDAVLTSSSVVLAMSFARPVVVPEMGCLGDLVTSDVGVLYDPSSAGSLRDALLQCTQLDLATMGKCALRKISLWDWQTIALRTLTLYQGGPKNR